MIFRVLGGGIPKMVWICWPTFTPHSRGVWQTIWPCRTIPRIACNVDHRAQPCTTIILTQKNKNKKLLAFAMSRTALHWTTSPCMALRVSYKNLSTTSVNVQNVSELAGLLAWLTGPAYYFLHICLTCKLGPCIDTSFAEWKWSPLHQMVLPTNLLQHNPQHCRSVHFSSYFYGHHHHLIGLHYCLLPHVATH